MRGMYASTAKANIFHVGQNTMIRVRSGSVEMKEIIKTGLFAILIVVFCISLVGF